MQLPGSSYKETPDSEIHPPVVAPMFQVNFGKQGVAFPEGHAYFRRLPEGFAKEAKDMAREEVERVIANAEQYVALKDNPEYKNVEFDWMSGGVKATHINHKIHPNDEKRYFIEQLNGDQLESEFMDKAFHLGHSVIFKAEAYTEADLDMYLDNELMDLISPTTNSEHYRNQLRRKNDQLIAYNALHGETNHSVCMYFHDPTYYSYDKVKTGLEKIGEVSRNGVEIKTVYILKNDGTDIMKLDFP